MKKMIIAAVLAGSLLGGLSPLAAAEKKPVRVYANLGIMLNGFILPEAMAAGLQVDVRLLKPLVLSPEFFVWSHRFQFDDWTLAPALLLNLRLGRFFLGGGVTAMSGGGYGGYGVHRWAVRPKFNLGLAGRRFKMALGAVPIDDGIAGVLTVGLGF